MPKVVRFHRLGPPEVLEIEDLPLQAPGRGEVRLSVEAFGLNRSESQMRQGTYPMLDATMPSKVGKEAVGVVDAVGADVPGVAIGSRVTTIPCFDMNKHGVYGESAIVPAFSLAPVPAGLSTVESAAIWQQYLTAYGPLVEYSSIQPGTVVLVTAATASVGHACIQLARVQGATVIATTRSAAKVSGLKATGADHVIVTDGRGLSAAVMEITSGKGADVIVDSISGSIVEELAEAGAYRGKLFLYGRLNEEPTPFPLITCMKKGMAIQGYTLWEIVRDPEMMVRAQDFIIGCLESGRFRPVIDRVFSLGDIREAHAYMDANKASGKLVVTVSGH